MARLYEFQGKEILKEAKVPIPKGEVAKDAEEAARIAGTIGRPVAVKSRYGQGEGAKQGA